MVFGTNCGYGPRRMETVFSELKRYVGFGPDDEAALQGLHALAQPRFEQIADLFYRRILEHEHARLVLEGGERRVGQLRLTLIQWLERLLTGPWDDEYYALRCRIGRVHVRINLPQHYMFGAMNIVRQELVRVIVESWPGETDRRLAANTALGKIVDLELAIMLHTYREDLLAQQARTERLATFGQLVGSISHELRNPLAVMETSLFLLQGRTGDPERTQKHLGRIAEQVGIANRIITDLLNLIRDQPLVRTSVRLEEVVRGAIEAVRRPESIVLEVEGLGALEPVEGDPLQLRQVVLNLLENAIQASPQNGRVRITGHHVETGIELAIEDSGPGVDPAIRHRLFEPLITTKETGIGLGLALVRRIAERHGGSIAYEPDPERSGARFVVRLPAARGGLS